jgi:hypothetical protein
MSHKANHYTLILILNVYNNNPVILHIHFYFHIRILSNHLTRNFFIIPVRHNLISFTFKIYYALTHCIQKQHINKYYE